MIQRWDLGTIANTGQKTMYKECDGRFVKYTDHLAEIAEKDREIATLESQMQIAGAQIRRQAEDVVSLREKLKEAREIVTSLNGMLDMAQQGPVVENLQIIYNHLLRILEAAK